MRSAYQSGWIWGNSVSEKACPPVAEWGWFCTDGVRIQIEWCKLDAGLELMTLATLVKTCKCKRSDNSCFHANVAIASSSNLYVKKFVIANNPVRRISLKYYFKA